MMEDDWGQPTTIKLLPSTNMSNAYDQSERGIIESFGAPNIKLHPIIRLQKYKITGKM